MSDLIVDQETGTVDYVIINIDQGVLDIGGTDYAVPYGVIRWDRTNDRLEINATVADFDKAPTFNASRWAGLEDRDLFDDVQEYFGYETDEDDKAKPGLFLASDLRDADLKGAGDQSVGTVEDLIVERRSGKVPAMIVASDDDDVDHDKLVPFGTVSGVKDGDLMANFDPQKLKLAHDAPDTLTTLHHDEQMREAFQVFGEDVPDFEPADVPDWTPGDRTRRTGPDD